MQRYFLFLFIFALAFIGCEINSLTHALFDTNALMVFLALSFLSLCFLKNSSSRAEIVPPGKPEFFLFLYLIWATGTFYFSVNPDLTSYGAMKCLAALAFGLGLILYLKNIEMLNDIWLLSFIFAGIHGVAGITEQFFPLISALPLPINGSRSFFTHPNFYSGYLTIHIPIGIYLYFNTTDIFRKNLIGIGWICILIALGFSGSMAGQLIAGLQIMAVILFFWKIQSLGRVKLVVFGVVTALIIYFSLNGFILGVDPLYEIKNVGNEEVASNLYGVHVDNRLVYWMGAWDIFLNHWLTGSGLLTFTELYPFTGFLEKYPHALLPPHAHSLYLQTASETGLIGFSLLMASILFAFKANIMKIQKLNGPTKELNFFLLLSFSGLLIHGISEYNWLISLFIYYFVLQIISMRFVLRENSDNGNKKLGLFQSNALFSISVFSIFLIGFSLLNYYQYNQIIIEKVSKAQTLDEVEEQLGQAKNLCERCGVPYYLSGFANLDEAKKLQSSSLIDKAQQAFDELIKRNPYNSKVYMTQGDIFLFQRKNQKAIESYKMAMRDSRFKEIAHKKLESLKGAADF
ncbi:MAG: O-antigen ligase [Nitrospinales bacterium]|jgi:O-antigen ligase